nr:B3 domain-containing transcription repressor VAL2 [Ipomoea batatas]
MGDEKAPGPDGFTAGFFKANWDIVGSLVVEAVKEFFLTGKLLKQWNNTCLALIPKKTHDLKVEDFRPIACCSVFYKIITKIIAARMSCILLDIVSLAQGAFVAGSSMRWTCLEFCLPWLCDVYDL